MAQIVPSNVETFGTLIVIGSIIFFTLLFAGTLQFLYLRRKNSAKVIRRRSFRYPLDYRMNCFAKKMRDIINDGIPELAMGLDVGFSGSAPYMSKHDKLQDQILPTPIAELVKYSFFTDDLTDEEYNYIQILAQNEGHRLPVSKVQVPTSMDRTG